jgi:hypothetical protein
MISESSLPGGSVGQIEVESPKQFDDAQRGMLGYVIALLLYQGNPGYQENDSFASVLLLRSYPFDKKEAYIGFSRASIQSSDYVIWYGG